MMKKILLAASLATAGLVVVVPATAYAAVCQHFYNDPTCHWSSPPTAEDIRDHELAQQGQGYYPQNYGPNGYPLYVVTNEVQNGRTKREKDPADRYQFCEGGIGWVPFGKPCTAYFLERKQSVSPAPAATAPSSFVMNGKTYTCTSENGEQVCRAPN